MLPRVSAFEPCHLDKKRVGSPKGASRSVCLIDFIFPMRGKGRGFALLQRQIRQGCPTQERK